MRARRYIAINIALISVGLMVLSSACSMRQEFPANTLSKEQLAAFLKDKPEVLQKGFQKLLREGQRNQVLNNLHIATEALKIGEVAIARNSLDRALTCIETVYADNQKAKKARSLWYEEGMKDFKGSPYERAMAYYYRGIIYLMEGDIDNGRASFKSGILQDAYAEEEQFQCDFSLLIFLEGFASRLLGDEVQAEKSFKEVAYLRPDYQKPDKASNLLLLVETGSAPRKVADGIGHGELKIFRGRNNTVKRVAVLLNNDLFQVYPMEDVAWQAMTRGGRPIDKIIGRQVAFRANHETISTNLTELSASVIYISPLLSSLSDISTGVGAGVGLLGIAQMQLAARTRTHADTRYWSNLPDTVHLANLQVPDGVSEMSFLFLDENGETIAEEDCTVEVDKSPENLILWKRQGIQPIIQSITSSSVNLQY